MSEQELEKLAQFRDGLNKIDSQMVKLFEERMDIISELAIFKMEHEMSIYDPKREQKMKEFHTMEINNKNYKSYYGWFLKDVLEISKQYQLAIRQKHRTGK